MRFAIPRRIGILIVIGLVLLALSGAMGALGESLRQNYQADCAIWEPQPFAPREEPPANTTDPEPLTPAEREACRDARLPVTVTEALYRAAIGPGIAIVAIGGVYILGAAIAALRRE